MDKREVKWMNTSVIPEIRQNGWIYQVNENPGSTGIPDILLCKNNVHAYIELKVKKASAWDIFEASQYSWMLRYIIAGNRNAFVFVRVLGSDTIVVLNIANEKTAHFLRSYPTIQDIIDSHEVVASVFSGKGSLFNAVRYVECETRAYRVAHNGG